MHTLFLAITLLATSIIYGQDIPVITTSKDRVNVNGRIMLVHKVSGGETLYSIAKAYNVTIDEIVHNNESLKAGLKEGSVIYIPSLEATPVQNVKVDLKKYSQKKHTVKWYEQLEDIALKYNVTVESIIVLNNLESRILKKKQVLYIPNNAFLSLLELKNRDDETVQENKEQAEIQLETSISEDTLVSEIKSIKDISIAYILPLELRDTIKANTNFMDFYAGALLAVNKLKENGYNLSISLIDQKDHPNMASVAHALQNAHPNIIIGPVKAADMEKILPFVDNNSIVVSPMDQNGESLIASNRNLVHIPSTSDAHIDNITDLISHKYAPDTNVVIISEKGGTDFSLVNSSKELLNAKGISFTEFSYGILEGREILEKMIEHIKPSKNNLVYVASNSEAFVNDVVRNLNLLCTNPLEENRRLITLFGTPRWRNFETIEIELFHRMNLHLSLPYFVDYSRNEVKEFLMEYRALFSSEPTPFSFQGYDITSYAVELIGNYENCNMLQSNYRFTRNEDNSGMGNKATINIIYNKDYTISVIE